MIHPLMASRSVRERKWYKLIFIAINCKFATTKKEWTILSFKINTKEAKAKVNQ